MNPWHRVRLLTRVFWLTATIFTLVAAYGAYLRSTHLFEGVRDQEQAAIRALSDALMPLMQQTLVVGDLALVQQSLDALVRSGSLHRAAILSENRRVVLTTPPVGNYDTSAAPAWFRQIAHREPFSYEASVRVGGVLYGILQLEMAPDARLGHLWADVRDHLLLDITAIALTLIFLRLLLVRGLKPLQALQTAAARIGVGDNAYRIPPLDVPEFEALGQAFNRMAASVQQRNEDLVVARAAAEAANQAKSEFLASMSHELRTPLNAVLGYAQLFTSDPRLSPDQIADACEIERAGNLLLALVNEVLDLSHIDSGKMELLLEPVTIGELVGQSFTLVAQAAANGQVTLIDAGGDGRDAQIYADPIRLLQVVLNFLTNAVKYNRPGGSASLSYTLNGGKVRIAVTDTGLGIPANMQHRVFEAFDRLGRENGVIEGTGVGLLITKRIVEAMDDTIGFDSIEGEGSTFWAEFPLHKRST